MATNGADTTEQRHQHALRSLAHSLLTSRLDFASRHGFQFEGDRDLYKALGYQRVIRLRDMRERYERGGIAKRIVDAKPKATWRSHPEVVENEGTQRQTAFERAWEQFVRRTGVYEYLERVDKLAGLGQYGVLLIGLGDGEDLSRPARPMSGPDSVLYLQPYAQEHARIERLEEDPKSERFGLPLLYKISIGADSQTRVGGARSPRVTQVFVHWSRVLHVADDLLESEVYGTPRLQPVWNLLDDLIKVVGGAGEMFWRGGYQGIQAAVDPAATLSQDDKDALSEQFEEYEHRLRRFIRTRSVQLNTLDSNIEDPSGAFKVIAQSISGTTEIPMRILFGSERGELASSQDRANWNERIAERQMEHGESRMLRPLIDRLQGLRVLPRTAKNRELTVRWPELLSTPETERAQISQRRANALAQYENARARLAERDIDPAVPPGEFREDVLGLPAEPPTEAT